MGRKAKQKEDKKGKISITVSTANYEQMVLEGVNKSQLINWLLEQHFNLINHGK
jgi:hypothetical protein